MKVVLPFFEITGDDIAQLSDGDLRNLIGLLCETELRLNNLDARGVQWGGHQDAPDGGFDVYVQMPVPLKNSIFLNRTQIGIQVKKPNMIPSNIPTEMRPKGKLRKGIVNLIENAGTYIIASSGASASKSALEEREDAMRKAVADEDPAQKMKLFFLDRGRIATWVRRNSGMILWVKNKIGRPCNGWRPFEPWSILPSGASDKYIIDETVRLFEDASSTENKGLTILDGINQIRVKLRQPQTSVRLTGLSGVGKTRFVQSLFDSEIGEQSIDPANVFYTDIADSPNPTPLVLAEQLIADGYVATIVLDNCPPDLHNQMSKTCIQEASKLSLITVEYDVRDDLPPETNVYRLEPSCDQVIRQLIEQHHPHISHLDADKITEFSGGNARVADALANTIGRGESLSGLRDADLFQRLFHQRHETSDSLLTSAEGLSLLYSFDGEDVSDGSELSILGSIIDKSARKLYTDCAVLKDRGLLQARSNWRAILPHAIANRLARVALSKNPPSIISQTILSSNSERMIRSFSRRLNFLHDSTVAANIAKEWLSTTGYIGRDVHDLSDFKVSILKNIAPVCPDATLEAIERAVTLRGADKLNKHQDTFVRLLRSIAYDAELFDRCVKLLVLFEIFDEDEKWFDGAKSQLVGMCRLALSGTWATPEQRLKVIAELCENTDSRRQSLGLEMLNGALESWHFSSMNRFEFGARRRDYGYELQTQDDVQAWFDVFLTYAKDLALSDLDVAGRVREIIASRLRGLWVAAKIFDQIELLVKELSAKEYWGDGWVAVLDILYFDAKGEGQHKAKELDRLKNLEELLQPTKLLDKARVYAFSNYSDHLVILEADSGDGADYDDERIDELTRQIGTAVAKEKKTFKSLVTELVTQKGERLVFFGEGLALGAADLNEIWSRLFDAAKRGNPDELNLAVLLGFINQANKIDPDFVNIVLDSLLTDDVFSAHFPRFQFNANLDQKGLDRLYKSLELARASIWAYQFLGWGRTHEALSDHDLVNFLRIISKKEGGFEVSIHILKMRFHKWVGEVRVHEEILYSFSRELLLQVPMHGQQRSYSLLDHDLATIARHVFRDRSSEQSVKKLCERLKDFFKNLHSSFNGYSELMGVLAELHPVSLLNCMLANPDEYRSYWFDFGRRENPLYKIDDQDILTWCAESPVDRYQTIADVIVLFSKPDENGPYLWKPLFYELIKATPSLKPILEAVADNIRPNSWSGSLSVILEQRSELFLEFQDHENGVLREWSGQMLKTLQNWIEQERAFEQERSKDQNETFE